MPFLNGTVYFLFTVLFEKVLGVVCVCVCVWVCARAHFLLFKARGRYSLRVRNYLNKIEEGVVFLVRDIRVC